MATELPATSPVLDDEALYRSVKDDPQHFGCDALGALVRLSHSAFNDRSMQPSVDRAGMILGGPSASRKSEADGVVSLIAVEVRSIKGIVTKDEKGRPLNEGHQIDVHHEPEPDNHSHAVVRAAPEIDSGSTFKRLKEALCVLASKRGWAFPPQSTRG